MNNLTTTSDLRNFYKQQKLTPQAFNIFLALTIHQEEYGIIDVTKETIAREANMSYNNTFEKYWRELTSKGYVKIIQQVQKYNEKWKTRFILFSEPNTELPLIIRKNKCGEIFAVQYCGGEEVKREDLANIELKNIENMIALECPQTEEEKRASTFIKNNDALRTSFPDDEVYNQFYDMFVDEIIYNKKMAQQIKETKDAVNAATKEEIMLCIETYKKLKKDRKADGTGYALIAKMIIDETRHAGKEKNINSEEYIKTLNEKAKDNILIAQVDKLRRLLPNKKGKLKCIARLPQLIHEYGFGIIEKTIRDYRNDPSSRPHIRLNLKPVNVWYA